MIAVRRIADSNEWHVIDNPPTEAQLLEEISEYERKIARVRTSGDYHQAWKLHLYRAHLTHRRKLLAAIRDGRPEAWAEYQG